MKVDLQVSIYTVERILYRNNLNGCIVAIKMIRQETKILTNKHLLWDNKKWTTVIFRDESKIELYLESISISARNNPRYTA